MNAAGSSCDCEATKRSLQALACMLKAGHSRGMPTVPQNPSGPPSIFSRSRRVASRRRIAVLQANPDAARYLIDDMAEDVLDRLGFIRFEPRKCLISGDWTEQLVTSLRSAGAAITQVDPAGLHGRPIWNEEAPLRESGFDFIASIGTLDTVNDFPGALIHMRQALAPGGLMIASFVGAGSMQNLRAAMQSADGDRPAARFHPMVDVRAGGQLLQRAGFSRQVADSRSLTVRFGSLDAAVADLRAQGLGNVLAEAPPPLTSQQLDSARAAFLSAGDEDGRVTERIEIVTLSGWRD